MDYGNGGYYLAGGDWGYRHNTPYGWIEFGPANGGHAHIYTSMSNYYFNVYDLYLNGYKVPMYGYNYGSSLYATIYYDANDTGYYCDPNGTSNFNQLNTISVNINTSYYNSANYLQNWPGAGYGGIGTYSTHGWRFDQTGWGGPQGFAGAGDVQLWIGPYNTIRGASAYFNIWYDWDNTGYYCDPSGTSNMNNATINNNVTFGYLTPTGIGGNSGQGAHAYAIFQEGGGWGYPYPDLRIAYHTGIKLGAYSSYEGIRFYDNHDMSTLLFQISGGSDYFYRYNWEYLGGYYGLYTGINSAHFYPNNNSYGSWRMDGSRNGYYGLSVSAGYTPDLMWDGGGNGGIYYEAGRWAFYHYWPYACMGIGTSSTASGYGIYVSGGGYFTGNVVAYSDRRKKKNIETIDGALDKVLQLRGVYYNRLYDVEHNIPPHIADKRQAGVIAQEVNEVFPEVVSYADNLDEYAVAYGNFAGLFIEAFKEQNKIILEQGEEIKKLKEILNNTIFNNKQ
jgi:hypothetical protein